MNYYPPQEAIDLFRKRTYYHIQLVRDNIYLWQDRHIEFFDELSFRATNHDRSKFFEPELTPYIWLTWSHHCTINNIPFELPRGMDQKIRDAIFHHVSHNRHHPEWHLDLHAMTKVDLIEMVCDWKAMSQEIGEKSPMNYANKVLGKKFNFSQEKCDEIKKIIIELDEMCEEDEKIKKTLKEITPSNEELLKMVDKNKKPIDSKADSRCKMSEVNIKKELSTLDRNNWDAVSDLVDRIVNDIILVSEIASHSNTCEFEALKGLMEDYMIELINPELLDFNSKEEK